MLYGKPLIIAFLDANGQHAHLAKICTSDTLSIVNTAVVTIKTSRRDEVTTILKSLEIEHCAGPGVKRIGPQQR